MNAIENTPPSSYIRIDGLCVDPHGVIAGSPTEAEAVHSIEVRLSAYTLLHELQECDVDVTEGTLRGFVAADAQELPAREAYLEIARARGALPPKGFLGFLGFRRRRSSKLALPAAWIWTTVADVQKRGAEIVLSGVAIRAKTVAA